MRTKPRTSLRIVALASALDCLPCSQASAQLSLPPTYGAAHTAATISADAIYMESLGDFLVKQSFARWRAAPTEKMPSSLLWVATYFERKELNRAYRLKANPPFLVKEEHRQRQVKRRIESNTDLVLKGDVTDELNWLLRELAGLSTAYQLLPGPDSLADSSVDQKLDKGDAHHLRLTDGGSQGGKKLIFRADTADVQETRWPRTLRRHQFDEARDRFEVARDKAVRQLGEKGVLNADDEVRLMAATDALCDAFNEAYPRKGKGLSSHDFYTAYLPGKQFLQSLAASVHRLIESNDKRVFDGSYRFEGDSAVDLLNHLARYGLQFARPEPGDEGTYRKLFFALRTIYENLTASDYSFGGALR